MENRRLPKDPVRDDRPVRAKGHDFEPPETTSTPKKDDPPSAYDCNVSRPASTKGRGGKRG